MAGAAGVRHPAPLGNALGVSLRGALVTSVVDSAKEPDQAR
jgi:hypothetical protein